MFATTEEYIGQDGPVTGLTYFVKDKNTAYSVLNPQIFSGPKPQKIKDNVQVNSFKTGENYKMHEGPKPIEYDSLHSIYVHGAMTSYKASEVVASLVEKWKIFTSDSSTTLQFSDVEPVFGKYG